MATYTFTDFDVDSFDLLYSNLLVEGVSDAIVSINGVLVISTDIGSEQDCQNAIDNSAPGTLSSAKADKINEISDKSTELEGVGVLAWGTGKSVGLSEDEIDKRIVAYQFYQANPSEISATNPYITGTIEGGIISTSTVADIDALIKDMKLRMDYIYLSLVVNSDDGSKSELLLRSDIANAVSISAVDAITDTRK